MFRSVDKQTSNLSISGGKQYQHRVGYKSSEQKVHYSIFCLLFQYRLHFFNKFSPLRIQYFPLIKRIGKFTDMSFARLVPPFDSSRESIGTFYPRWPFSYILGSLVGVKKMIAVSYGRDRLTRIQEQHLKRA